MIYKPSLLSNSMFNLKLFIYNKSLLNKSLILNYCCIIISPLFCLIGSFLSPLCHLLPISFPVGVRPCQCCTPSPGFVLRDRGFMPQTAPSLVSKNRNFLKLESLEAYTFTNCKSIGLKGVKNSQPFHNLIGYEVTPISYRSR